MTHSGNRNRTIGILLVVSCMMLLLPVPEGMKPEAHRLISVTLLMAGLWVTQAIPMAATSMIPLGVFPFLGIMPADLVSKAYVNDTLFLYLGGMIIALGIERWQLHRRLALNLVAVVGVSPKRLVLGFLVTTAGLSMWISNTACTLLMLPIAVAMMKTLDDDAAVGSDVPAGVRRSDQLTVPLLLAISYASSLGGMSTIVGTPTNNAAVGIYRDQLPDAAEITVAEWIMAVGPISLIYLAVTWFVLTRGLPGSGVADRVLRAELRKLLRGLGPATVAERRMLLMFGITGLMWVCRRPLTIGATTVIPGWLDWYTAAFNYLNGIRGIPTTPFSASDTISDSSVAMLMAVVLFILPSGMPDNHGNTPKLMDWSTASRLPWDMILMFGGGFALAEAFRATDLSAWLGDALQQPLQQMPPWFVIATLCSLMTFLTEFTSNVATVSTLMPTLLAMSGPLGIDARMIFIPAALAASCAFMMPIATPPNAIVFGTGRVPIRQMISYGLGLNLVGIPLLTAGAFWFIGPAFGISDPAKASAMVDSVPGFSTGTTESTLTLSKND